MSGDNEVKLTIHQAKPVIRWSSEPSRESSEPSRESSEPSRESSESETQMQRVLTSSRWAGEPRIRSVIHDPKPRLSFINTKSLPHWIWVLTCEAGSEYILIFINEPFRLMTWLDLAWIRLTSLGSSQLDQWIPMDHCGLASLTLHFSVYIPIFKGIN